MMEVGQNKVRLLPSWRVHQAFCVFMFFLLNISIRQALNFGVVCMVKSPDKNDSQAENDTFFPEQQPNSTIDDDCVEVGNGRQGFGYEGEFDWTREQVGYVLGSFFYGYIFVQLPTGYMATRFGAQHVLGVGMLLGGLGALLTPLAARTHIIVLIALRALMGATMGVTFPSGNHLLGQWAPPLERSFLTGLAYAGPSLGGVLTTLASSWLCPIDWTIIHYITGSLTILWCIYWYVFGASTPSEHRRISEQEKQYIVKSLNLSKSKEKLVVPWLRILLSPRVWAVCAGHFSIIWAVYTLGMGVPLFNQDVLKFDIKSNGVLNAGPSLLTITLSPLMGLLTDKLAAAVTWPLTRVRKLMQCIANIGGTVFIVSLSFLDCSNRMLSVVFVFVCFVLLSFNRGGVGPNSQDIAPKLCGVVYGFANTVSQTTGFFLPLAIGHMTTNGTKEEWQHVFYLAGGVLLAGLLIFIICGSAEEQEWAKKEPETEDSVVSVNLLEKTVTVEPGRNEWTVTKDIDETTGK